MGAQAVRLSNVDIDKALDSKDFEVRFQPIFDLGNGALARMETFVRWRHPALGVLPPGAFISFFESQGRMSELTRYVLGAALKAYTEWRGTSAPGFSLNLALSDLSDEAFSSHFIKLLRDYDFPADLVTLECPMPPVDTDIDTAAAQFARLGATGARLAIEVRGRANDLLRNIDPFPFDEIKTGGSSILRFARTVRGPGLSAISDLLDIANNANAVITAVGVEDQTSLAALRGLGFTAAQGNHLGKVGDISDFMPRHVNDVRKLLGLEKLSSESLTALFRTDVSTQQMNELEAFTIEDEVSPDALIDRLNNRLDQQNETEDNTEAPKDVSTDTPSRAKEADEEEKRKTKARNKAKILAVAKREKAREIRKAAAIARAKAKSGASAAGEQTSPSTPVPRELQQRLNEEFASGSGDTNNSADFPEANNLETDNPTTDSPESKAPHTPEAQAAPVSTLTDMDGEKKLSVPEKLAAAAIKANAAAMASLQTPAQTEQPMKFSLQVGTVEAYFQPGIVVGGPAFNQEVRSPSIDAANAHMANAQNSSVQDLQPDSAASIDPVAPEENMADMTDQSDMLANAMPPEDSSDDTQLETGVEGDLYEAGAQQPPLRSNKRRKSFLKRTVLPYPTYFWPKSWARRYRRMTTKRPANDMPENTVQAAE